MPIIKVSHLENYIRRELPLAIQKDLLNYRMVREADLETSVYFHLRNYLDSDSLWRVLARKHADTEHYIDILIFKSKRPRIAIELKWDKKEINPKDTNSLTRAIDELNANRAYFISTITHGKHSWNKNKPFKVPIKARNILAIFIPLGLNEEDNREWNERKRIYTSKMSKGKARHK